METYALSPAVQDIAAERERQMAVEGIMPAHDDTHTQAELPRCAMAYLDYNVRRTLSGRLPLPAKHAAWAHWPYEDDHYFKPTEDLRRNLVKAAALITAEIERLDRAGERNRRGTLSLVPNQPTPAEEAKDA
jgi:hypothetical protein